jgi:hypothetical protein
MCELFTLPRWAYKARGFRFIHSNDVLSNARGNNRSGFCAIRKSWPMKMEATVLLARTRLGEKDYAFDR